MGIKKGGNLIHSEQQTYISKESEGFATLDRSIPWNLIRFTLCPYRISADGSSDDDLALRQYR